MMYDQNFKGGGGWWMGVEGFLENARRGEGVLVNNLLVGDGGGGGG